MDILGRLIKLRPMTLIKDDFDLADAIRVIRRVKQQAADCPITQLYMDFQAGAMHLYENCIEVETGAGVGCQSSSESQRN